MFNRRGPVKLTYSRKNNSRNWKCKQHTISSASLGSCSGYCVRSLRLLTAALFLARTTATYTGAATGLLLDSPTHFYPTSDRAARRRQARPAQLGRISPCRSRNLDFPAFPSQIKAFHLVAVPPLQILIIAILYADIRAGVFVSLIPAPMLFGNNFYVEFRWFCLTFCDRLFALSFHGDFLDRRNVGQKFSTNVSNQDAESGRSPRLVRENVPGGFGNLVPMRAAQSGPRAVRRAFGGASLVYPNNCPKRRADGELQTHDC